IALQLPDWNHWLPRVAPEDLFGAGYDGIAAIAGEIEADWNETPWATPAASPSPARPEAGCLRISKYAWPGSCCTTTATGGRG
ncbi:hypothetical protein ABTN50_19435, partial [Acinetobacter baumannii]